MKKKAIWSIKLAAWNVKKRIVGETTQYLSKRISQNTKMTLKIKKQILHYPNMSLKILTVTNDKTMKNIYCVKEVAYPQTVCALF